jgi:hypothetical protein
MTDDSEPDARGEAAGTAAQATPDCLCMGLGPQLTTLLRSMIPTTGLAESIHTGQLEALKFLKTIIDQRIATLSGQEADTRGTRVTID